MVDRRFRLSHQEVLVKSYGCALTQYDRESLRDQDKDNTQIEGWPCEDAGEDSHLQAKRRSLEENQTCRHLDLGLPASKSVRKTFSIDLSHASIVKPVAFCYGSLKTTTPS